MDDIPFNFKRWIAQRFHFGFFFLGGGVTHFFPPEKTAARASPRATGCLCVRLQEGLQNAPICFPVALSIEPPLTAKNTQQLTVVNGLGRKQNRRNTHRHTHLLTGVSVILTRKIALSLSLALFSSLPLIYCNHGKATFSQGSNFYLKDWAGPARP